VSGRRLHGINATQRRAREDRAAAEFLARITEATTAVAVKPGDAVSWKASRGKAHGVVVSTHKGKVPNVPFTFTGSADAPAARVQLMAKDADGKYKPTGTYLPLPVDQLTSASIEIADDETTATEATYVTGSFEQLRDAVRCAICERIEELAGVDADVWVCDMGPGWAVYQVGWDGDYWLVPYSGTADAVVLGEPSEVYKRIDYVPVETATEATSDGHETIEGRLLGAAGTDTTTGGRVFRVQIIKAGDSKNGRRYPEGVLSRAAALYEGAKAYDHHRTDAELMTSTIDGLVGSYRNVESIDGALHADLVLLPSASHTAEALDASLAQQAAGLPPLVGISHDVQCRYRMVNAGGRQMQEATQIVKVNSADVVADPAAGGEAIRMVAGGSNPNPTRTEGVRHMTIKQLLTMLRLAESDQRRAELLVQHAHVLEAAGITADEATRMAEAVQVETPAPTRELVPAGGERSTEATFARTGPMARTLVFSALAAANLDERLAEGVLADLPDQLTESMVTERVTVMLRMAEGFERAGLTTPSVPANVQVTTDEMDRKIASLDAMFDPMRRNREGYRSLRHAWADITGYQGRGFLDTEDIARRIMRESATVTVEGGAREAYDSTDHGSRSTESLTSGSWGLVLGDSITRRMIAFYEQPSLQTWRSIVSAMPPINDFRTQRLERIGGYGTLPAVAQGAPYQPLTSPTNEEVTYSISKRGGTEDLTLEMIANDDMRSIATIPQRLGLAAAQTLYRFVWDFIITNPTIYDSTALFAAGHGNTAATALSGSAMSTIRQKMRAQAAYGDSTDLLSLTPRLLVVCNTLEELAFQLVSSAVALPTGAPVGAASNTPNLHAGTNLIVVDYWSSTTAWFAFADPQMVPTIEIGFYQGQEDPALFVQSDPTTGSVFTNDKLTYKIRHIYGGAVVDYRGMQRGNS
jgi:hypothetical protein